MRIEKIHIEDFRHLTDIQFKLGKYLTAIAGGNGTGKTSILGLLGHMFKFDASNKSLFGHRFETRFSSVFRFSIRHDIRKNYKYNIQFEGGTSRGGELRTTNEGGRTRHRIDVGGRVRGGGKIRKPVIFLSLKRLLPLAQEDERKIQIGTADLTEEQKQLYNTLYKRVFMTSTDIVPEQTISQNKNTYSPTSSSFDSHGISAGQDNIGHIILSLLSFRNLKEIDLLYNGGLLLIDEIDATLYPAAQKNLLTLLLEQSHELDLQIIFTTHSSDILNFLASRKGSIFKNSTNFISLSDSSGSVKVNEGFKELKSLLADLNHEALRTIKPKKLNFYFEDSEACLFYKSLIDDTDLECEKVYKNLTLSSGTYKTLIEKGFEEFFRSIIVLDGDFRSSFANAEKHNVIFLPGLLRPENIIKDFLYNLPENDSFWNNSSQYTKRVFLQNLAGIQDNREQMKRWFNSELTFWGDNGVNLFTRWKESNVSQTNEIINQTKKITTHIFDNFYELSTNS